MNDEYNQYGQDVDSFQVHGHTVTFFSPTFVKITIRCPFDRTNAATTEQNCFVLNQTRSVISYMIKEDFFSVGMGISIIVLTSHR